MNYLISFSQQSLYQNTWQWTKC